MNESNQISILFVCRNFHQMAGGIERMASLLMNQMVDKGYRVGLITWDPEDAESHYPLNASIKWMKLNLGSPFERANLKTRLLRLKKIRTFTKVFDADVAICFQVGSYITAKVAMLGLGIPTIAAERNSPDLFNFVQSGNKLRKRAEFALKTADCITLQFESYREKYGEALQNKFIVIPNPVIPIENPPFPNESPISPTRLLHVGRLSYQKNQSFLLRAFAKIAQANPTWVLTLVGDGEQRQEVEDLISKLGLEKRVELIGAVTDLENWYSQSACLVFPSLWEGFPNAVVEAMSYGLPVIGLTTTSGVNELVKNKVNGLLSDNNEKAFANTIQQIIDDDTFRQQAGREARKSVLQYRPGVIFDKWSVLFTKLASRKNR